MEIQFVRLRAAGRHPAVKLDASNVPFSHEAPTKVGTQVGKEKKSQAIGPISTGELNTLLCLHLRPINLVVFQEPRRET